VIVDEFEATTLTWWKSKRSSLTVVVEQEIDINCFTKSLKDVYILTSAGLTHRWAGDKKTKGPITWRIFNPGVELSPVDRVENFSDYMYDFNLGLKMLARDTLS
jgi:hypothetical protein